MPKRKAKDISKEALTLQSRVKLNSGYQMPMLGFGVSWTEDALYLDLTDEC
jgi:hypothetical protein